MTAFDAGRSAENGVAGTSLLVRLGGEHGLRRLVQHFHSLIEQMPGSWSLHRLGQRERPAREALLMAYLHDWLAPSAPGGPGVVLSQRPCRLRAEERDEWLLCMRLALEAAVSDIALRDAIWQVMMAAAAQLVETDDAPA